MKSRGLFLFILLIFSCNTNKEPGWVTNPPEDDALYYYFVLITDDGNVLDPLVEVLMERFSFDNYIQGIVQSILTSDSQEIQILDNWDSGTAIYSLVRVKRSFLEPLRESLVTNIQTIEAIQDDFENSGDVNFDKGELYSAYQLYLKSLKGLLERDDFDAIPGIIRVLNKIESIILMLKISDIKTIGPRETGTPFYIIDSEDPQESLELKFTKDGYLFKGFIYSIRYMGPQEELSVNIALGNNSAQFVPPIPVSSGEYKIKGELNLGDLVTVLELGSRSLVSSYIRSIESTLDEIVKESSVETSFVATTKISSRPLLVSFTPSIVGEGVVRRLLEDEVNVDFVPEIDPLSREHYLREILTLTSGVYRYMVTGEDFKEERVGIDGDVYQRVEGNFSIIDIFRDTVVYQGNISTEFLMDPDQEDLAYLDIGLLIGEELTSLVF